ncbi:MAG: AbrB/MazE/SpoVT family DNA-binding domain-containing protein [Candidatus Levyibacteriota bacterium]
MTQKIIQIGNSTGIILPKELLMKKGLKAGSAVFIEDSNDDLIIISKTAGNYSSITPGFVKILEKVNKKYGPALRALAQK